MSVHDQITVYSPEPALKHPLRLVRELWQSLLLSRALAWRLMLRNIRAQYRQSLLGVLWAFIPPIAQTVTWVFLNSAKIFQIGDTGGLPYPVFVMVGTLLWAGFTTSLNKPIQAMTAGQSMLTKLNFPREALILAGAGEVIFDFLVKLIILIPVFIWFQVWPGLGILLAPLGMLAILILGFAIGILLTPLGMLYNDIGRGISFIVTFWFFITPVVYPLPKEGLGAIVAGYNPVTPVLTVSRSWLVGEVPTQLGGFLWVSGASVLLLILGLLLLRIALPHLIARIGS